METTRHAEIRMQQRGIPSLALDLLLQYGRSEYSRGDLIRYFDQQGLEKAKEEIRKLLACRDKLSGLYFVEGER